MLLLFRLLAFLIDYLILGCYGVALFGLASLMGLDKLISSPWVGQLTGFLSLTLPVVLYFSILESSSWQASIGKCIMRLRVTDDALNAASFARLLTRNLLKFLPWEIAHLGIHWAFFYNRQGVDPPTWVWIPIISSQLLALCYLISIIRNPNRQGLYERWSGTRVIRIDVKAVELQNKA
jgi:uncharacterized RDD family membrane protein YckC